MTISNMCFIKGNSCAVLAFRKPETKGGNKLSLLQNPQLTEQEQLQRRSEFKLKFVIFRIFWKIIDLAELVFQRYFIL